MSKAKRLSCYNVNLNVTPTKKKKNDGCVCIIHCKNVKETEKTTVFSKTSRDTVYNAAIIRANAEVVSFFEEYGDDLPGPDYGYHRACYQEFTHSKTLKTIIQRKNETKERELGEAESCPRTEARSSTRKKDRGGLFDLFYF